MAEQVVVCPKCNSRVSVPTEAIGRSVECLCCRETFVVPSAAQAEAAVEAALLADDRRRRTRRIVLWSAIAGGVALLILAAAFLRSGWPDTPEGVARRFMSCWQRADVDGMKECLAGSERQQFEGALIGGRDEFIREIKDEFANVTVTVKDARIDGDSAEVEVEMDRKDSGKRTETIKLERTTSGWRITGGL